MRFTVEIPDPLYHQALEVAKERNMTFNELVIDFVECRLETPVHGEKRLKSPPISGIKELKIPALTNKEIAEILGDK